MAEHKGIKRHESLKPLSRHHMVGLHLAIKLKRAGTEDSRLTIKEIIEDARGFWIPDGNQHFREEEEVLLPMFARYAQIDRPEIIKMLLEHVQIRSQIESLIDSHNPSLDEMHELGFLLEKHIRTEERVIFPIIEKSIPEEKLLEIAHYLH